VTDRRRAVEILLVFSAFFLPGYLSQASMPAAVADMTPLMLQVVVSGIPQVLLMMYLVCVQPGSEPSLWGLSSLELRDTLWIGGLAAACGLLVAGLFALRAILPPAWSSTLDGSWRWRLSRPSQAPLALLFGLTAGYREEFFYRAYLLRRLGEAGLPEWLSVALSTALFAVGHLYQGVIALVMAVLMGVVFSLVYIRRRNVHVVALGHGLYNGLALCASLLVPFPGAPGSP
jgi:uncharacterized protein